MDSNAQPSIHQRFDSLATSDLAEFRQFFRRLHKLFPEQAAEASLLYIAAHGMDTAAQSMAYWLAGDSTYISLLLEVDSLTAETASKAIAVVKDVDPQFSFRFAKATAALTSPTAIIRALGFLPILGDYSLFIPWLRSLGQSVDARIRSRSAKLLCELRPNKGLIERQMQSSDPRVRAGALEVLWKTRQEDSRSVLRLAVADSHHRVVSNALVGLYLYGETDVINEMIEHCGHKQHLFRAAMAWALGFIKDQRGVTILQELTRDPSAVVRKRALKSLLDLESAKPELEAVLQIEPEAAAPIHPPSETPIEPALEAEPEEIPLIGAPRFFMYD